MKLIHVLIGAALLALSASSSAATVQPFNVPIQFGVGNDARGDVVIVPVTGTYRATLTDIGVPSDFDLLIMAIADASHGLLGFATAAGTSSSFLFNSTAGDTIGVAIAHFTSGVGAFGADITLVPIPAALWLFGSALGGLLFVARRRREAAAS